jgi:hypothetical protein
MADLRIDLAAEFLGRKAFKEADTAVNKLQKSTVNLGRTLGIALSTTAIVAYGKASVRAFADAEAQQQRLVKLLKVGVGATDSQIQALNEQADALERVGVVSAGNVTQVQSQLATFNLQASTIAALTPSILDYVTAEKGAAASTEEFRSATNGLAQALNGNFTSLTRVGFVIDQNTRDLIKNGTEAQRTQAIIEVLDSTYKGFNASLRNTAAGGLQLLTNASDAAKESIGEGLVDALARVGGGTEAADAAKAIENIAKAVNVTTLALGTAIGFINKFRQAYTNFLIDPLGTDIEIGGPTSTNRSASPAGTALRMRQERERKAIAANAAKREKERLALLKKQELAQKKLTAEQKKQAALKKAGTVFDLDQIELVAALKGKLSEEDRKRIEAQLALLNNNDALAQKLTREILMAQDATGGLYRYFLSIGDADIKNPFAFLDDWIIQFQNKLNSLKFPTMTSAPQALAAAVAPTSGVVQGFTPPQGVYPTPSTKPFGPAIPATNMGTIPTGNFTYGQGNPLNTNVYVTVQGSVTTEDDLVKKIASGLQNQSLSTGDSAYINRRTGGFAG